MKTKTILNIESDTKLEKYTFEDIPTKEVGKYADIVVDLSHCNFETEIESSTYSSETSKPICVAIDVLTDSIAFVSKLYRDGAGKYFVLFAELENGEILKGAVVVEGTDDYQDFMEGPFGCVTKSLMPSHLECPTVIPVGRCV